MVQLIERHQADASQIVRAQQTSWRPGESAGLLHDVATEDDLTAVCALIIRAALWIAMPTSPARLSATSPTCKPMRTSATV